MPNYYTLTIGPIYDTMAKAQKTRELWASSYLFSYLIRKIAEKIKKEVGDENYILPFLGENPKNGAGLYPDRIIAEIPDHIEFNDLLNLTQTTINEFATEIAKKTGQDKDKCVNYLNNYLRFPTQEISLENGENIIECISSILDAKELSPKVPLPEDDALLKFLSNVNNSFLIEDGFNKKTIRFDSILEVSAKSLDLADTKMFDTILNDTDENKIIQNLKLSYKDQYRPHQKYVAIVHADGDNIGETIRLIGSDKKKIQAFSKFLFDFATEATSHVVGYGGMPIYMGGDDMLFFAPIGISTKTGFKNILDLCALLDKSFNKHFKHFSEAIKQSDPEFSVTPPTISYGIHVSYYKFPLYEALEASKNNLWEKAKNEALHPNKNCISFSLRKHSGQLIQHDFEKDKLYDKIKSFMDEWILKTSSDKNDFLNSLTNKIEFYDAAFKAAADIGIADLKNFFNNNFNEDIHIKEKKTFIYSLAALTSTIYESKNDNHKNMLYTTLRIIHFLNAQKDE